VGQADFMLLIPAPRPSDPDPAANGRSISDEVQWLIDEHNRKQQTRRFCSVDEVAINLGLPPRPHTDVNAWIATVGAAVQAASAKPAPTLRTFA
jgi:hypothetical protein